MRACNCCVCTWRTRSLARKCRLRDSFPLDSTLAGETFRKREVEVLHHSELAQLPLASVQRGLGLGVRSLCLVPLLAAREPVGVLKVASRSDHAYAPRDVELLTCAAAAIAPVVD